MKKKKENGIGAAGWLLLFCLFGASIPIKAQNDKKDDILCNADIISLCKYGLSKEIMKAKIQNSRTEFNLSTDSLLTLKKSGVGDDIIIAMMAKSTTQHTQSASPSSKGKDKAFSLGAGLYYKVGEQFTEMEPELFGRAPSKGVVGALKKATGGFVNYNVKGNLSGTQAIFRIRDEKPVYYFVFDTVEKRTFLNDRSPSSSEPQSPNDFYLIRLKVTENNREIVFNRPVDIKGAVKTESNIYVADNIRVPFIFKKIYNGIYEVRPRDPLQPGEYSFILTRAAFYIGASYRIYDFGYSK